jgi:hypothetical protein
VALLIHPEIDRYGCYTCVSGINQANTTLANPN